MSLSGTVSSDKTIVGKIGVTNTIHGKSAYEIALLHGFEGTEEEWIASLKGEKGDAYIITEADKEEIADKIATDNLQDSAEAYIDSVLEDKVIEFTSSASGKAITIESANAPLQSLKLYGSTTQDGTPTPTEPKALKSVGDSGSFNVGVYGSNILDLSQRVQGSGGSYTVDGDTITFTGYENIANYFPFGVFIDVAPNTLYTLSFNATSIRVLYIYADWYFGKQVAQIDASSGKCTFNSGNYKRLLLGFYSYGSARTGTSETVTNLMLNVGGEALPYESFKGKQSLTMPYTLYGIPVSKDGNYTDENGQQWYCDEVDFVNQKLIKRTEKIVLTGSENWKQMGTDGAIYYDDSSFRNYADAVALCTHTTPSKSTLDIGKWGAYFSTRLIGTTVADVKTFLTNNNMTIIIGLITPIETPLSETELNAYRSLMTNSGNTTILSEADMTLDYYTPKGQALGNIHTQINKDYFKLTQAIISTGGN